MPTYIREIVNKFSQKEENYKFVWLKTRVVVNSVNDKVCLFDTLFSSVLNFTPTFPSLQTALPLTGADLRLCLQPSPPFINANNKLYLHSGGP